MKLIDILNKIANGELKEGTKVIYYEETYILNDENELERELGFTLLDDIYMNNLSDEVELIEPQEPTEHLPDVGKVSECFSEVGNTLEPTDNTKIEELELGNTYLQDAIIQLTDKLNEVINKVNAQTVVVLSQEKDIEEIKEQLDY